MQKMEDAALCSSVGVVQSFNRADGRDENDWRQGCLGSGCFQGYRRAFAPHQEASVFFQLCAPCANSSTSQVEWDR